MLNFSTTAYIDSNSEDSDSDLSDVPELDSDLEAEKQQTYQRAVYKEDMAVIKKQQKQSMSAGQKRAAAPSQGLKLEFVHGWVWVWRTVHTGSRLEFTSVAVYSISSH